jgi:hypothetical protein
MKASGPSPSPTGLLGEKPRTTRGPDRSRGDIDPYVISACPTTTTERHGQRCSLLRSGRPEPGQTCFSSSSSSCWRHASSWTSPPGARARARHVRRGTVRGELWAKLVGAFFFSRACAARSRNGGAMPACGCRAGARAAWNARVPTTCL